MQFKAALFDFDGVIVDSTPVHLCGWQDAYTAMFKQALDPESLQTLVGRSTAAIGSILAKRSGFPTAQAELIRRKANFVFDHLHTIPLIEGADLFIEALQSRKIPMGIVSNAPRAFIEAALKKHGLCLPFFLGLEDYQRPKPDAEPYMKGAARLSWNFSHHANIFVFEDSTHGIEAAMAAHMTPIGICSQHPEEILCAAGAKLCFKNLKDALSLLD